MNTPGTPVVHIGMPKAASKTLQWNVFARHSEIFYLGRLDGPHLDPTYKKFESCRDADVQKVMSDLAYHDVQKPVSEETRAFFKQYLERENTQGLLPVWSWESYSTDGFKNREARANNLKTLFGQLRIVMVTRNPIHLLESAYLQQLKRDNVGERSRGGKPVFFPSIDNWLSKNWFLDIGNHLDYAETIEIYCDLFGEENVCVLPFEELVTEKQSFYQKLCNFMGIDLAETLANVEGKVENKSWTDIQLEKLAAIKASPKARWQFRRANKRERHEMLDLKRQGIPATPSTKAKVAFNPKTQDRILSRTREGNLWLQERFGLDLEKYGYFGS